MALRNKSEIRDWSIYTITNPNGRVYVGRTVDMSARIRNYKHEKSVSQQPLVYRSFKKYGFENHKFEIIDTFSGDNRYCNGKEIFWIRTYMSNINKYPEQKGMNLTDGGDGTLGFKKSDAEKAEMVKRYTGRKMSERTRLILKEVNTGKQYCLGKKHSQETKDKMSATKKGKKMTDLCLQRMVEVKRKPVIQYNCDGGIVLEHISLVEAAKYYKVSRDTVRSWINNPHKLRSNLNHRGILLKYK